MNATDIAELIDSLTDEQYEAATRLAEKVCGVGLTGLSEDNPDEAAEIIGEALAADDRCNCGHDDCGAC